MKKICVGILAHVDAGKTTLAEAMLYTAGSIRKLGRVDRRDSFLDNFDQERKRGITIFSKQARLEWNGAEINLLDTPGHADFSSETERCLQVLDCAILVISGTDGTQAHTRTLCELLERYKVPTFIFVTKRDVSKLSEETLMEDLKAHVGQQCVDISKGIDEEETAVLDEELLEKYIDSGKIGDEDIARLISERKMIPCRFGSGLKLDGVEELLSDIVKYSKDKTYGKEFAARVFKIARDNQGKRMTHMKITGGSISTRMQIGNEKISQIRLYSGQKYDTVEAAEAGEICTVLGLADTYPGQGLGAEKDGHKAALEPVLGYRAVLPAGTDPTAVLPLFRQLEEEDPQLHIDWNSRLKEIQFHLLGTVQTEILKAEIKSRFGIDIDFDEGKILYKESIKEPVEGVGHYEPLKHYAEVHLLIEPLPRNSGIQIESDVSTDELDINWQRLILTHLQEKQHLGVLTGSPLTDVKITLIAGRAHLKHTEGGDFRQATYRAVRQGLMEAQSVLLEPIYSFVLEVPAECIGRAISDVHAMEGEHCAPYALGDSMVIEGTAPAAKMAGYLNEVLAYTGGRGRLSTAAAGYRECTDAQSVIEAFDYHPEQDIENSPDSVFCAHGAGFNVPWNEVLQYCHIPCRKEATEEETQAAPVQRRVMQNIDEAELEAIMQREFGPIKRKSYTEATVYEAPQSTQKPVKERIIVDGYNVIFAWEDLKELSKTNLDLARSRLVEMLVNYRAFTHKELVLVFDAYAVPEGRGAKFDEAKLHVVYTKEGETADAYIEKIADEIGKNESVKIVSSDSMVQLSALRSGVLRISAREFRYDFDSALKAMREKIKN